MGREGARDTLQPDKRAEAGSARGEPFSTLIGWERLTGDAERARGCTFTSCVTTSQLRGKKRHVITSSIHHSTAGPRQDQDEEETQLNTNKGLHPSTDILLQIVHAREIVSAASKVDVSIAPIATDVEAVNVSSQVAE
ncbi:unnamed protein product [Merluccius merluccius]